MISRKATIAAIAAAAFGVAGIQPASAKVKQITIGSNPAGSVYFLLASGLAALFQEKLQIRSTAQPHAGSSVYLPLLDSGEITLGVNSSLDSGMAWNGTKPYQSRFTHVRTLARIWVLPYAYLVKNNSGITKLSQLKGKDVTVTVKTNVSLARANTAILATAGLTPKTVNAIDSGGVVAGINLVVQDRADATTAALAMPALRKSDATVPGGLRILPLGPQGTDAFLGERMPGLYTMKVSNSKQYPFVHGKNVTIAAFDSYMNAGTTVTDEEAYQMVKTMYDNWKDMQKSYAPLRGTPQKGIVVSNGTMPYHPGAVKFYKEVGLWTAPFQKHQDELLASVGK